MKLDTMLEGLRVHRVGRTDEEDQIKGTLLIALVQLRTDGIGYSEIFFDVF